MGILGLEWFMQDFVSHGVSKVNICDEITQWKQKHPNETPIIIIDLTWLLYNVINKREECFKCAGRNNIMLKELEDFFMKICSSGAKLEFFERVYDRKLSLECENPEDKHRFYYTRSVIDFDNFKENQKGFSLLGFDIEHIAKKWGEVKYCYIKRYAEVLNYLKKNKNVLAILAKDANFLMSDLGSTQYWSCGSLRNLNTFMVNKLSDSALHQYLGMSQEQKNLFEFLVVLNQDNFRDERLPFFSYENFVKLGYFNYPREQKWKLSDSNMAIALIASYVQRNSSTNECGENFLKKALKDIFYITEQDEEIQLKILKEFQDISKDDSFDEEEPEDLELFHEDAKNYQLIYNILFNKAILFPPEDLMCMDLVSRNDNNKSYIEMILPLYKRMMGILLQHRADETIKCELHKCRTHDEYFSRQYETPIYPEIQIPDLDQIIFKTNNNDTELTDIKWQLMFWTLSIDYDNDKTKEFFGILDALKPVVLTLVFLKQEKHITEKEANTILITEVDFLKGQIADNIELTKYTNRRATLIAHCYVQVRKIINHCLRVCGLKEFAESIKFDGVHFYNLSERYEVPCLYRNALAKNALVRKCGEILQKFH